jgi:diguanylate cyclase (GGDEF)-like protein
MAAEATSRRPTVDEALDLLRAALADAIRAEQLRDRLTGLGNDEALSEWIEIRIESGRPFWIAFIEVDRFKSINDKYGYDDADLLLQRIAGQLQLSAKDFFPDGALPIRAHGDEFFLVGDVDSKSTDAELLTGALDQVKKNVAAIRVYHRDRAESMTCTVSIGWLLSTDLMGSGAGLELRAIRGKLELAVVEAKRTRDTTVRFSLEMKAFRTADGRADCPACGTKFTLTVKEGQARVGSLSCPNCAGKVDRPPSLAEPVLTPAAPGAANA